MREAVLNGKVAIAPGTVPKPQGEDVAENTHRDFKERTEERCIDGETKASVKHLVSEKQLMLVEELVNEILR